MLAVGVSAQPQAVSRWHAAGRSHESLTMVGNTDDRQRGIWTTFSGRFSGTRGLPKIGAGTITYSDGTTLAAGTLSLANNQTLGTRATASPSPIR
jgi:hypothetical protein